jgi:hypothetical protein
MSTCYFYHITMLIDKMRKEEAKESFRILRLFFSLSFKIGFRLIDIATYYTPQACYGGLVTSLQAHSLCKLSKTF